MVVSQGNNHNRPDLNLAVDDNSAVLDAVHAENRCLRDVDDRGSVERAEDATVGAVERTAKSATRSVVHKFKSRRTW